MELLEQNLFCTYVNDSRNSEDIATVFNSCDLADLYNQNVVQLGLLKMMCTKQSLTERLFAHVPDLQAYKQGSDRNGSCQFKSN